MSAASNHSESKFGRIYDVPTPYVPFNQSGQQTLTMSSSSLFKPVQTKTSLNNLSSKVSMRQKTAPSKALAAPAVG